MLHFNPIITQRNVLRRSRMISESFLQEINRTYTCNKFIHLHAGEKVYDGVCITSRAISPQLHKLESPEEGHWEHVPAEKQRHRNYHNTMTWDLASHPCTLIGLASGFSLGASPASWNGFVWGCQRVCRQKENHTSQSTCIQLRNGACQSKSTCDVLSVRDMILESFLPRINRVHVNTTLQVNLRRGGTKASACFVTRG